MSRTGHKLLAYLPGVAAGLYAGRLLSELWANWNGSTTLWLAAVSTALSVLVLSWLLGRFPLRQTWPAFFLLFYVFFPENSIQTALLAALFTFLVWFQVSDLKRPDLREWLDILLPLVLLLLCFTLYVNTLAPDLLTADNGEFQLVAANLGVAHPPGFALYTMLSHLMTRLPFGPTAAYRVNLFSAVTSTLTLAAVYAAVFLLTRKHLAALAALLALATATTFWAQATTANIRSMTALFAAAMFLTAALFYLANTAQENDRDLQKADRALFLFALFFGLGIAHHASLAFLGIWVAVFLVLVDPELWRTPARWWRPLLGFLLGLLPLLYLPLRANADVRGASPALATLPGFLEHALATGFRGDLFVYLQPVLFAERLRIMLNVLTFQFSPALVLLILLALILLIKQDWRLAFLYGGSALLFTLVTATYRAPQTVEYMLPAYVALALLLGAAGGGTASSEMDRQSELWQTLGSLLTALIIVLALNQGLARYDSYKQLSEDYRTRDYAKGIMDDAPAGALVLANWHWATPLWYLQEVEGERPDVEVRYVFPEGEQYAQTWARRAAEGLADGRDVITTNFDAGAMAGLPPPEPMGDAFLFRQEPRLQLPADYAELDLKLGETVEIVGYQLQNPELALGGEESFTLAWKAGSALEPQTSLFVHLVDADGRLAGQSDVAAAAQDEGITLTRFYLSPFAGVQPGTLEVHIGAYGSEPLLSASGEAQTTVTAINVLPAASAPATGNPLMREVQDGSGRHLAGLDVDNTLPDRPRFYLHWQRGSEFVSEVFDDGAPALPAFTGPWGVLSRRWQNLLSNASSKYVPLGQGIVWTGDGQLPAAVRPVQALTWRQRFLSGSPVQSDQVVSVRLIGYEDDGFHWAWSDLNDAVPAMGAIPTLKWISGSRVTSPHFVEVSDTAESDQLIGGALTLYDAFTGRVLPILDGRLAGEYGWIPLSQSRVHAPAIEER